ncbi:phosphate uptake regulator PhoU [Chitinimonas sp.]|uniref:phosphate signaling complex PhoU family protein n=1 Tax=Chitinimonas sp. TaxID=1934313 RepID=UPI0035B27967
MADHILKKIDADAQSLRERQQAMAALVAEQLADAMVLLERCYLERGLAVEKHEARLNELQLQLDRECTQFIALHQPNAGDLRQAVAAGRIAALLEACGNGACRIAEAGGRIHKISRKQVPALAGLMSLYAEVAALLAQARQLLHTRSRENLLPVLAGTSAIPAALLAVRRSLCEAMPEAGGKAEALFDALLVAQTLADLAALLGELALTVWYEISGDDLRHAGIEQIRRRFDTAQA